MWCRPPAEDPSAPRFSVRVGRPAADAVRTPAAGRGFRASPRTTFASRHGSGRRPPSGMPPAAAAGWRPAAWRRPSAGDRQRFPNPDGRSLSRRFQRPFRCGRIPPARHRCDGKRSTTLILRQPSRGVRSSSPPARAHAVDVHYTPSTVAKALVRVMRDLQPALIADLAAGNGDLLIEAERMWPTASFVATDIDRFAVRRLARHRPSWSVGRCDLRSPRSRASCRALKNARRSAGLMLLNPPFSCRGGTNFRVQTADGTLRASTAMSFLLLSTPYVADDGHIATVLPLGCMYNVKDVQAWKHLESMYKVKILENYSIGTFPNSSASTVLVHLSPRCPGTTSSLPGGRPTTTKPSCGLRVEIVRGSCPVHRPNPDERELILVHYTDIRNGLVELNGRRGFGSFRCVDGPAVLIPRVGRITAGKIALLHAGHSVMLSDCVIALTPDPPENACILRKKLVENLNQLSTHYIGTGAPFITIDRLKVALETMGVHVD